MYMSSLGPGPQLRHRLGWLGEQEEASPRVVCVMLPPEGLAPSQCLLGMWINIAIWGARRGRDKFRSEQGKFGEPTGWRLERRALLAPGDRAWSAEGEPMSELMWLDGAGGSEATRVSQDICWPQSSHERQPWVPELTGPANCGRTRLRPLLLWGNVCPCHPARPSWRL